MDVLKVFLSDDDPANRDKLIACLADGEEVELVGTADTPEGTVEAVCALCPHAVLLNMEERPATDTLSALRTAGLKYVPFLLVVEGDGRGLPDAGRYGADYVLSKARFGNGWPRGAADALRTFASQARRKREQSARQFELDALRRRRIGEELDKVGISRKNTRARRYLTEAIRLSMDGQQPFLYYTLAQLYEREGASEATVALVMERAIDRAWRSGFADQGALYQGRVSLYRGSPAVTDFIRHYAEKLKNEELQ